MQIWLPFLPWPPHPPGSAPPCGKLIPNLDSFPAPPPAGNAGAQISMWLAPCLSSLNPNFSALEGPPLTTFYTASPVTLYHLLNLIFRAFSEPAMIVYLYFLTNCLLSSHPFKMYVPICPAH